MAKIVQIEKESLEALHEHYQSGGDYALETVAPILGIDPEDEDSGRVVEAYLKRLRELYPDDYPEPEDDEEEESDYVFLLVNEDSTTTELEMIRKKGEKVFFRIPQPKDEVTIFVAGKQLVVDLIQLATLDPNSTLHGKRVADLIAVANMAKG